MNENIFQLVFVPYPSFISKLREIRYFSLMLYKRRKICFLITFLVFLITNIDDSNYISNVYKKEIEPLKRSKSYIGTWIELMYSYSLLCRRQKEVVSSMFLSNLNKFISQPFTKLNIIMIFNKNVTIIDYWWNKCLGFSHFLFV